MRKQHSPAFKAKIVLQALRETKPLTQVAAENEVHPTLLTKWKSEAVNSLPEIFERGANKEKSTQEFERQSAELYEQIGRLSAQLAWVKKKAGLGADTK
nr:transposase [Armatimonas sp.]